MRSPQAHPQADGDDGGLGGIPRTADDVAAIEAGAQVRGLRQASPEQMKAEAVARQRADLHARIDNDFVYHAPTEPQVVFYATLRDRFRSLAHFLIENVPPGRELSTALTKLEECVMHANAGIARGAE